MTATDDEPRRRATDASTPGRDATADAVDSDGSQPSLTDADGRATVSVSGLAGLVAIVLVVAAGIVFARRLSEVTGLFLAAIVMAVTTLPVQRRLARAVGQAASLASTAVLTIVVCVATAFIALRDLTRRAETVAELVDRRLDQIRSDSLIGEVVRATRLDTGLSNWLATLPRRAVVGAEGGGALATQFFLFLTVVVLATFLQASGAGLVDRICSLWPRSRDDDSEPRRTARDLADDIECRGFGYFRRVLVVAAGSALVVGLVGSLVDLPGAIAIGIWLGTWAVVPVVGIPIAIAPVLALVALDQRPIAWVVVATSIVTLAVARVLRRNWIESRLDVSAAAYTVAVAAGVSIAGFGGSVVALAVVAALASALASPHQPGQPAWWRVPADRTVRVGTLVLPTGWRFAVVAAGTAAVGVMAWSGVVGLGRAAVWIIVAAFVAVALSRPVGWLDGRLGVSRRGACNIVLIAIALMIGAAALTGADDGARATTTLTERLPHIVADLERTPVIGGWLAERDAALWVERQMEDLPQRVRTGRPADWLPFVGDRVLDLFWIVVLSMALLVDGPRLVTRASRLVPARHRRQWDRLIGATGVALGGYAAGAALVASINATVIFVIAVVLGLGVAPALALWGFIWNFVPQIGGFVGGVPLVVFAFVLGPLQGLFAGLAFTAYQFIENHLIQPAVIGAAIDLAPWGTLLAALAGAAAAGVVGAIVVTPLVGVIGVIRRELARDDFPGVTAATIPRADHGDVMHPHATDDG